MAEIQSSPPVRVFCGYHERDSSFHEELRCHLTSLVQTKRIDLSGSGSAPAGSRTREFQEKKVAEAQVIVLLVSPDLIAADLWWTFWEPLVSRLDGEHRQLVPVSIRSVELSNTALAGRTLLPRSTHLPLAAFLDRDAAWSEIAKEIQEIVHGIQSSSSSPSAGHEASSANNKPSLEDVRKRKEHAYGLKYRGRAKEALEVLELALRALEALTREDPANVLLKKERAHLHDRIAQCDYTLGRFEKAQKDFDSAYEIRLQLRDSNPGEDETLFDLSTSHFWRGYLAYLKGDLPKARREQQEGVQACRDLCQRNKDHIQAARSLVVLETDLGTTLEEMKDSAGAQEHLRGALALARKLAAQNPENWQIERDVSVGLFRLADFLVKHGETTEAMKACEESVQRCWALASWAPTNIQWRRHLATARISMGDVRLAHDDLTRARGDYEFATGTMGALAAMELEDVQGTRHYARAEKKLGELLFRAQDPGGALAAHLRAAAAMEAACRPAASLRWDHELEEIYTDLLRAHAAVPGADSSVAATVRTKAQELRARLPVTAT